jgi:two-component system response regulator HydG
MNAEKKSVLIVEDDKAIIKSFKDILQSEGYSVDSAETGREAIQKSKAQFYNLVLLDIKLPDMEGTKLLTTMHETSPKMVKIMITGYPSLENAVEALNMGADAYIMKPVNPEKLLALIEEKLKKQSQAEKMTEEKTARNKRACTVFFFYLSSFHFSKTGKLKSAVAKP